MEKSSQKTSLVTGGAGFLGSHLCDRLVADGRKVICIDDFSTGRRENIEHMLGHKSFDLIEHDITSPIDLEVNEIYNLACPASPPKYQSDPIKTNKTSVLGAINMLDLANKYGARILQASTSEVYGDPEVHPQHESYWGNVNPVGVRSCYDEGKRCAETLFFDYKRQLGVDIRVARIFNTYGPRMDPKDGRVVSNFIVQALLGQDLTIYGDGSQTRSFCYVSDMIEGLVTLMNAPTAPDAPINIGNEGEFTVLELAQLVLNYTRVNGKMRFYPIPSDDPARRRPDTSAAQRHLNWQASVSLEEGLAETVRYFAEHLNKPATKIERRKAISGEL